MFTIYVKYTCLPGKREAYVERVKAEGILAAIRAEDGCVKYDYYFSQEDPNEILLIEQWESKQHQQVHLTQPHMDALRAMKATYISDTVLGEVTLQ